MFAFGSNAPISAGRLRTTLLTALHDARAAITSPTVHPKNGEFTVTVDLETPTAYAFRYILDGTEWENDWEADRYVPSTFAGSENAVVEV